MYNGLEVRVPFCDYRIVEYAYNMPWGLKALVIKKVKEILQNNELPINKLISKEAALEIIEHPESIKSPWYGQLMGSAQVLAYILQMNCWLNEYNIII